MLLCSCIKFLPITQPARLRYPYIILQSRPRQVKIAAHQLMAWLSQGPPPNKKHSDYNKDWTPKTPSATTKESASKQQQQQQQPQPRVVVCHNDLAITSHRSASSNLKYTNVIEVNTNLVPKASICLSKSCVNPKCLYYDLQSNNCRTGSHHRVRANKHSKAFAGKSCDTDSCAKCIKAQLKASR